MLPITRTPIVSLEEDEGISRIVISNGVNSCLNNDGLRDLLIALTEAISAGDSPILITSDSKRAFCMGYTSDCKRISDKMHIREAYSLGTTIARTMLTSKQAVISAIDGYALGLGMEIAMCSDLVIATERAKFGMPEVAFGIPSLTGILPEVPERFSGMAYSLIKKGKIFDAYEAKEAGIVKELVSSDNFQRHALGHVKNIESRLFRIIKSGNQGSQNRYILDDLFFKIYDPSCLTMMQLERFRNSI